MTLQEMHDALIEIEEELCCQANDAWEELKKECFCDESLKDKWRFISDAGFNVSLAVGRLETYERQRRAGLL